MLTIIEKVLFLQNIDIFDNLLSEHIGFIASIAEEFTYPTNQIIYNVNEHSDAMYLVIEGQVRLHISERDITIANDKDAFGTWALVDDSPRVVSATTLSETRLLKIDKDDFVELLADHVQMTQAILKSLVTKMRSLVDRVGLNQTNE